MKGGEVINASPASTLLKKMKAEQVKMIHGNSNVSDLGRSLRFYEEALDLHEVRRKTSEDFTITYLFLHS